MSETATTMHHVLMDIADYFRERCRNAAPGSAEEKRFGVYVSAITDADRMLKEQEPRVLTLEEVENQEQSGGLWLDSRDNDWAPMEVLLYEVDKRKDTFMSRSGLKFYANKDTTGQYGNYGTDWRCWSSRPTDEQREAVPWME